MHDPNYISSLRTGSLKALHAALPKDNSKENSSPFNASEVKKFMNSYLDSISPQLREISLFLCDNPELGFEEVKAHKQLTTAMKGFGFSVSTPESVPTAFVAEYEEGEGGRVFGINSEYDALKGIGQACGHNLIAIVGVGIAAALKAALIKFSIPGKIKLIGTPAEEHGGGKIVLLDLGIYDDLDVCVMAHPFGNPLDPGNEGEVGGGCTIGGPGTLARASVSAEYHGVGAHAGAAPWLGINALDAAVNGYNAISMLRQQIQPDHRVHGLILGNSDWSANVIPNYAKLDYDTRAPTLEQTQTLLKRVVHCFEGAATATGCTVAIKSPENDQYAELRNNEPLTLEYQQIMETYFPDKKIITSKESMSTASTDFGNVTYKCPSIHPMFTIPSVPGGSNHTKEFADSASKPEAHTLAMNVAKGLSAVGVKYLKDDKFARIVKKTFDDWKKD